MLGLVWCAVAGAAMSVQGVMNTRLGERIGTMEANCLVSASAALLAAAVLIFYRTGSFGGLHGAPWYCFLGGALGFVITVTVMLGIGALSPTMAVSVILISQLVTAAAIEALGLMGTDRLALGWPKLCGLALMIAGIIVFKK